ncbi:hypothetical protein SAMN06265375_1172 [Muriicola jejuensis]|nr:hypothetical protein SAMN06265375_1172 [Muriicola jejuensis]
MERIVELVLVGLKREKSILCQFTNLKDLNRNYQTKRILTMRLVVVQKIGLNIYLKRMKFLE